MDDFGMRLRGKVSDNKGRALLIALADAAEWVQESVIPNIESEMEKSAEHGKDRTFFKHRYSNGYRPDIGDLEALPIYDYLKAECERLGVEFVVMSHQMLKNRDPKEFPCIEIMFTLPNRFRDLEKKG